MCVLLLSYREDKLEWTGKLQRSICVIELCVDIKPDVHGVTVVRAVTVIVVEWVENTLKPVELVGAVVIAVSGCSCSNDMSM